MRWRLCWCKNMWPAHEGRECPKCGKAYDLPTFEREYVAPGIEDHKDIEGTGGTVRMVTLKDVEPGTYLEDFAYGEWGSPEMEAWLVAQGFPEEEQT